MDSQNASATSNAPNSSAANASYSDHGSKATATVALVAACIALGAVAMYVAMSGQLIDAKILAGSANAMATANQARTDARLALEQKNEDRTRMAVLEDRLNQRK
jgi:uncharacterized protein HemX